MKKIILCLIVFLSVIGCATDSSTRQSVAEISKRIDPSSQPLEEGFNSYVQRTILMDDDIETGIERQARQSGCEEASLSVSLPSRVFYEDLGYEVVEDCSVDVGGGERLEFWKAKKNLLHSKPRPPQTSSGEQHKRE